ncbi:unnamed protein product [Periconia digitata]|uniref:Postreplication repair E3 ubiquitin-protein ligase RAD18 n=1 Tax=Periconia digitata TaxID=1303443 RepID=A0A9W4UBB4_9PLEO|nr:unnamed protein product [Periconia digitata]
MPQQSTLSFRPFSPRSNRLADKASSRAQAPDAPRSRDADLHNLHSNQPTMPAMELSKDVPDSTDWLPTAIPAFSHLEAALRCEVCKEFYNNPVTTSCAHTFCSLCIRRCISVDGKCPSCRSICQADKLVMNIAIREVVAKWQDARADALELARDKGSASDSGKKRKVDDTDLEDDKEPIRQTRARSTRSGRSAGAPNPYATVEDSGGERDEYLPAGFVRCPMCSTVMKQELVFDHVEVCTGENTNRTTRSSKLNHVLKDEGKQPHLKEPTAPVKRMAGLNYAMLSEAALRKKLKELGIPNSGSKPVMVRRHQEWINIFNSNCDAAENVRKTERELLRELEGWERAQGASTATIMKKDFDGTGHGIAHKSHFDKLVEEARAKAKKRPQSETRIEGRPETERPQAYKDNEVAFLNIGQGVEGLNAPGGRCF